MTEWVLDFEEDREVYRCSICGNDACSACGGSLLSGFIHVFWHEDICDECAGPPLTDAELEEIFND